MGAVKLRFVRLTQYAPLLVQLQYPNLKKGRHRVIESINDPRAYDGIVLGIEYGEITAWVYERHTTNVRAALEARRA